MTNWKPTPTHSQYIIRIIAGNKYGDVYGITIPKEIANEFIGIKFNFEVSGGNIILKSGAEFNQFKEEEKKRWLKNYS